MPFKGETEDYFSPKLFDKVFKVALLPVWMVRWVQGFKWHVFSPGVISWLAFKNFALKVIFLAWCFSSSPIYKFIAI